MCLRAAEESPRFDQVLALGRKLVDELDLESSTDTLGRWMAHYIADLMDHVDSAPIEERAASKKRCFEAILELWSHRAELPNGKRPFEDLEPIMRAIESLDPENDAFRYFPFEISAADEAEEDSRTQTLIQVARNIDYTARILIVQTLVDAAISAENQSKKWITLAQKAGFEIGAEDIVIRLTSTETDVDTNSDPNAHERDRVKKRIDRLEAFIEMAKLVVEELEEKLK